MTVKKTKKKVVKKAAVKKAKKRPKRKIATPVPVPEKAFDRLNKRQQVFVLYYLESFNATRAALKAGYSSRTARSTGCENLTKPNIAAAISELLEEKGITEERIKVELARIAFGMDLADFEELGTGKTLQELRRNGLDTTLLKKVKIRKTSLLGDEDPLELVITDIEMRDKLGALRELIRVKGMGQDNINVQGDGIKINHVNDWRKV